MATENDTTPAGWTPETLKQLWASQYNELRETVWQLRDSIPGIVALREQTLNQRLDAAEHAVIVRIDAADLRYQQRFEAQQAAVAAALLSADRRSADALAAADKQVQASLLSADKAISKAEAAQMRTNETQNEWRATVTDLTKTVAERARFDSENMVTALSAKLDVALGALNSRLEINSSRLDKADGRDKATASTIALIMGGIVLIAGLITLGLNFANRWSPNVPTAAHTPEIVRYYPAPVGAVPLVPLAPPAPSAPSAQ